MKLVFIGGRSVHILGGIENYMLNLTRELSRLGHECIVWCESDHSGTELLDGVRIIHHKGPKSNLLCKPWCGLKATLRTLLREKGTSLIHYNAWGPSLSCWLPRLFGVPSLMEGHGLEWQRSKYSPRARRIMRFMEGFSARMNQHLIMCSQAQVDYFRREYGIESVCIPGAVTLPDLDRTVESDILERFALEPERYFLFMGRLVQEKNPDYLIRAFMRCRRKGFKLVVAGGNDAMPGYVRSLHEIAAESEDVVFTGPVYGNDKEQLLRNAFCFCIPSTIEGLSIVMMEAASYKLPAIASDIEANRELLGEDAVYVRPENEDDLVEAFETALSEPERLQGFSEANYRKIVEQYTWERVAARYLDYLGSIGVK